MKRCFALACCSASLAVCKASVSGAQPLAVVIVNDPLEPLQLIGATLAARGGHAAKLCVQVHNESGRNITDYTIVGRGTDASGAGLTFSVQTNHPGSDVCIILDSLTQRNGDGPLRIVIDRLRFDSDWVTNTNLAP